MSVIASNNSPPAVPEEHDKHGNLVMNLSSIGINNVVRFVRTGNGIRFSMVDVVQAVTGKNGHYANKVFRGLSDEVQKEVGREKAILQFKGPGQKQTTLITYEGVLKLIMALPGINASESRMKLTSVMQKYLHQEIPLQIIQPPVEEVVTPNLVNDEKDMHGNLVMNLSSIGLNGVVRFVRTENGVLFSMMDVVRTISCQNNKNASKIIERLQEQVVTEVSTNCRILQFKGPGQKETKVITYEGVLKLIMALPGINAREMRTKFASVLQRYFAGDITLIDEIADNYVSPEPINNMAREALPQPDTKEIRRKRRQETAEWNMQRKRKFLEAEDEVKIMKLIGMGKLDLMDMEHAKILQHEKTMSKAAIDREQDISKEVIDREKTVSNEVIDREKTVSKEQIERGRTLIQIESEHLKLKQDELKTQQELLKVTKELQDELKTQQELLQVTKELQEVNKEKCTLDPPYTIARVAERYGLLDSIKDMSKREKILACAGKLVRSDRFNLAPLPVKTVEGAYYVYQYAAQSINTLKEAVLEALCMTQKEEKPVITIKHFFHSR